MDKDGTPQSGLSRYDRKQRDQLRKRTIAKSALSRDEQKFLDKLRERMIAAKADDGDGYAIIYWVPNGDGVTCHRRCEAMPNRHFPTMHKQCGETLDFWHRASRKPIRDENDEDETEREDAPDEGGPEDGD